MCVCTCTYVYVSSRQLQTRGTDLGNIVSLQTAVIKAGDYFPKIWSSQVHCDSQLASTLQFEATSKMHEE